MAAIRMSHQIVSTSSFKYNGGEHEAEIHSWGSKVCDTFTLYIFGGLLSIELKYRSSI